MEESGFSFLEDTAQRIRGFQLQAQRDLAAGRVDDARVSLQNAAAATAVLAFYDIPVTETRQLVYDAGRLFALGQHQQAVLKLDRAAGLMQQVGEKDGPMLRNEANEVLLAIGDLRLAMQEKSAAVPEKFKALGHRVNMMALKSDLILSGAHLLDQDQGSH